MKTTVEQCEQRDTKGRYEKARKGEFVNFPGVDGDYDVPQNPEIIIEVDDVSLEEAEKQIVNYLRNNILKN